MLVFFVLGLGGEWSFMAHWGSGGGRDGDSCGMIADAVLMKGRRHAIEVRVRVLVSLSALPVATEIEGDLIDHAHVLAISLSYAVGIHNHNLSRKKTSE